MSARLAVLPWRAVAGLGPVLEPALVEILAGVAAERVVDRVLRQHRAFTADQRLVTAEALFGVGLWRRRLRCQVGAAARPLQLLGSLMRDQAAVAGAEALLGVALPEAVSPQSFADRHSLPDWLTEVIELELGTQAEAFAEALSQPGPICFRANLARVTREALAERLLEAGVQTRPGLACSSLVVTSTRPNVYGLPGWSEGLFEVQDDGSQLLGELVGAQSGDEVLDLCAGAGGKTLQLAALLQGRGRVHAFDVDPARLERLRRRAERAHVDGVVVHAQLPATLKVDRVLVDAPCSELGALRRGPDLRWRLHPGDFGALPALQRSLLEQALKHLRPGGRLVYATCTFRREENDQVAAAFAQAHPELDLQKAQAPAACLEGATLRTWPHRHGCDAFYGAVFQLRSASRS